MSASTHKLKQQLLRDKKKLGIMVALLAIGMLLWGRLLLKQVPRTAVATPTEATAQASTDNPKASLVRDVTGRAVVSIQIPDGLSRDLFTLDDRYYPRRNAASPTAPVTKSGPERTDVPNADDLLNQALAGLELQSTVLGDRPMAMINGELIAVGLKVNGLTLKKVMPMSVVLEFNGVETRLDMKR